MFQKFINDTNRNKISEEKLQLSKIFEWFKGDFTKKSSLIEYLNKNTIDHLSYFLYEIWQLKTLFM